MGHKEPMKGGMEYDRLTSKGKRTIAKRAGEGTAAKAEFIAVSESWLPKGMEACHGAS